VAVGQKYGCLEISGKDWRKFRGEVEYMNVFNAYPLSFDQVGFANNFLRYPNIRSCAVKYTLLSVFEHGSINWILTPII
jgi:hypothetical protein